MFSIIFTTFVFVVVINAYNLIDGVDGLAASFSVFAIYLIGLCFKDINLSIFQFCNVLIAILLPFFFINFSKKHKMFLGDTGSLFLGTTIILFVGYLLNSNNAVHVPCNMNRALYALVALCYPLLDTLRVFTLRLTRGQSPFRADKSHLHHKLLGLGFSHFTTTASLLTFNIIIYLINCSLLNEVDVNAVLVADFMLIGFFFIGGLWYTRLNKSVHE
jgi:UDP-N-acetylmuramyl pentapeptide phosphotransferase/UDP-N-acetylglucosamine-1-phosphate transferase